MARQAPAALALDAAGKLQAYADTMRGPGFDFLALVCDFDRKEACEAFARWALASGGGEWLCMQKTAAYAAMARSVGGPDAATLESWAEALREWAREQPPADAPGIVDLSASEPWVLVDPRSGYPYQSKNGWTVDVKQLARYSSRDEALASGYLGSVAVPLSRAEATAYANGKPSAPDPVCEGSTQLIGEWATETDHRCNVCGHMMPEVKHASGRRIMMRHTKSGHRAPPRSPSAPRDDVPAPGTPVSPVAAAEAAQGPTAGERWDDNAPPKGCTPGERISWLMWDGPTFSRDDGQPYWARKIDAAIADAVAGYVRALGERTAERASDRAEIADLTESRAVALRELEDVRHTLARTGESHLRTIAELTALREGIAALVAGQKGRG